MQPQPNGSRRTISSQLQHRLSHALHLLDKGIRRYRWLLRMGHYLRYRKWLARQRQDLPEGRPIAVFDFRDTRIDGPGGRRFYGLFIFFVRAGYFPVILPNYLFLANFQKNLKNLCLREEVAFMTANALEERSFVLVTDREYSALHDHAERVIVIDYGGAQASPTAFPLPFPMYPEIYAARHDAGIGALRRRTRQWMIYFGGAASPKRYNKRSIISVYRKLPRGRMLEVARSALGPNAVIDLESGAAHTALQQQAVEGLVISELSRYRIPLNEWLPTLATARFYLAGPGYRYPMSHNIIEAMAVGTVPITEYPELFCPPLQDGVNCLAFSGEKGLTDCLQRAKELTAEEWQSLSDGAGCYYDAYLAPEAVIQRLLEDPARERRLNLLPFILEGGGYSY